MTAEEMADAILAKDFMSRRDIGWRVNKLVNLQQDPEVIMIMNLQSPYGV